MISLPRWSSETRKAIPMNPKNFEPVRRPILDFILIFRFIAPVPWLLFLNSLTINTLYGFIVTTGKGVLGAWLENREDIVDP